MGTTAGGYPYPEPTEPVSAGADAIKALAQAADTQGGRMRIAHGSGSCPIPTAGSAQTAAVTLPAGRFTAAPRVVVCATGTTPMTLRGPMANSITATAFEVVCGRDSGTTGINFAWLAVQTL